MKKVILIVVPLLLFALEYLSFQEALQRAKKEHKPIMIEITSSHCHYCKWMEKTTLQDNEVQDFIKKHFIPVRIDVSRERLPGGVDYTMTPTFIFMDEHEEVIKKIPGAWKKRDFLQILQEVSR